MKMSLLIPEQGPAAIEYTLKLHCIVDGVLVTGKYSKRVIGMLIVKTYK